MRFDSRSRNNTKRALAKEATSLHAQQVVSSRVEPIRVVSCRGETRRNAHATLIGGDGHMEQIQQSALSSSSSSSSRHSLSLAHSPLVRLLPSVVVVAVVVVDIRARAQTSERAPEKSSAQAAAAAAFARSSSSPPPDRAIDEDEPRGARSSLSSSPSRRASGCDGRK